MSNRTSESVGSIGRYHEIDHRRRSTPLMGTSVNSTATLPPPIPRVISPPPPSRSPPPRSDKLSLRLRSNSGLALHTNEAALSQYIDYRKNGSMRPSSFNPTFQNTILDEEDASSTHSLANSAPRSLSWTANSFTSCLPLLDFLGKDAFQTALNSPDITRHLFKYCKDRGCEDNLEFLIRIREYTQSTNEMASILTGISTSFIVPGATHSLNLPTMLSRALNADIKRVAHNTLPSLEAVFFESRSHVERRMMTTIFPGFVKNQVTSCTAAALSVAASAVASSKLEYPGLGESFCITDASNAENTIMAVTDGFLVATGYPLQEVVGQSCGFLQGPYTDPEVVKRLQTSIREERETVELLLNHRKDGESFWNLLFLYPLRDEHRRLHYWLGAQINVSDCVGSRKDLLRVLNGGVSPDVESDGSSDGKGEWPRFLKDSRLEREFSIHSRDSSRSASSRNRFLQQFRKPPRSPVPSPLQDSRDMDGSIGERLSQSNRFTTQRFHPRTQVPTLPTTYSHHILLRCNPPCAPPSWQRQPTPTGTRKKQSLKLNVAFYSEEVLELLCLCGDTSQTNIFHILSDKANSPSITKSFKSSIRERTECGKSTSIEITVDTSRAFASARKNSLGSMRPKTADFDSSKGDVNPKFEKRFTKGSKQQKLMSHWTPVRNNEGMVEWVVLVLMPGI